MPDKEFLLIRKHLDSYFMLCWGFVISYWIATLCLEVLQVSLVFSHMYSTSHACRKFCACPLWFSCIVLIHSHDLYWVFLYVWCSLVNCSNGWVLHIHTDSIAVAVASSGKSNIGLQKIETIRIIPVYMYTVRHVHVCILWVAAMTWM